MFRFLLSPDGVSLKAGVACQEFVHLRQIQGGITWADWDLQCKGWKIGTSNDKRWHKITDLYNIKHSTWTEQHDIYKRTKKIEHVVVDVFHTRRAPTRYILSYNPYKWPCKWVTGVIPPINWVITILITGRGPPCIYNFNSIYSQM